MERLQRDSDDDYGVGNTARVGLRGHVYNVNAYIREIMMACFRVLNLRRSQPERMLYTFTPSMRK